MKKYLLILLVLTISVINPLFANNNDSLINEDDSVIQYFLEYETGAASILYHTIQFGSTGDTFNYVNEGGQDILFPFERFNIGAVINDRHRVSFLYQPLEINTVVKFKEDRRIDGNDYGADTTMELKYGFPFWRVSYSYDLLEEEDVVLGVGAALQIRNASIVFKTLDDSVPASVSQNVGLVPALHVYSRWSVLDNVNLSADITGLYASSAFINGADFEFEGSILDASLRAGYVLKNNIELFGNLRFLGGTAKGTSEYESETWAVSDSDDRFTSNYLSTFEATVGFTIR